MGHIAIAAKATLKLAAVAALATSLSGCFATIGGSQQVGDNVRVGTSVSHDFESGTTHTGLSTGIVIR